MCHRLPIGNIGDNPTRCEVERIRRNETLFSVLAGALALVLFALPASANPVNCIDLAIDENLIVLDDYPQTQISSGNSVTFVAGGDPVISVKVAPPDMLLPAEDYVCNVDYNATLKSGTADVTFNREGPYIVRVIRLSTAVETLVVGVDVGFLACNPFCGAKKFKQIERKPGDVAIVSSTTGWGHTWGSPPGVVVNGIAQARQAILDAYNNNGGKVQVSIKAHGSPGCIAIGNDKLDINNLADMVTWVDGPNTFTLKDKISKMTLYSCSVANGVVGKTFVDTWAQAINANITAYEGVVSTNKGGTPATDKWWAGGPAYTGTFLEKVPAASDVGMILLAALVTLGAMLALRGRRTQMA